ncbi:MAG: hypothetical protein AABY32_01925 [Nanoarchaeota archaeon]
MADTITVDTQFTREQLEGMDLATLEAIASKLRENKISELKAQNIELAAKVSANNAELVKLGGKSDSKATGTKVPRNTREAIVAVIDGVYMTPPEIVEKICAGSIFNPEGMDNKNKLLYVHTELNNGVKAGTIIRDGKKYTLAAKE